MKYNPEQLCPTCKHTYTVTGGDFDPNWTLHPGAHWREIVEHSGVTQADLAKQLDISSQYLSNILCCSRLPNVDLTVAFAQWAGIEPRFAWQWVANYKLDMAMGKKDVSDD